MAKPAFTKAKQAMFLTHLRAGMRRGAAAETLGFERSFVLEYIDDHEDYEAKVLDAEGKATEHVEEALYQAAISGHVGACKMWLDLRKPASTGVSLAALVDGDEFDADLKEMMDLADGIE